MSRTTEQTLDWYRRNAGNPPFNPNGMCLKICRTARGIGAVYPSAVAAQEATPSRHRIHRVADIVTGMVIYYDDPRDENPYGHIVTVHGRVKGADRSSLHDLLVWTNSVKDRKIVLVRGDYFPKYWGDKFQFASNWLNGQVLDLPDKPKPKPEPGLKSATNLYKAIDDLQDAIHYHRAQGNDRLVRALKRDIEHIRGTIRKYRKESGK